MRTRTGRKTAQRRLNWGLGPNFDRLDPRLALSGSTLASAVTIVSPNQSIIATPSSPTLSVVSTTPANSALISSSPSTLLVTFDRQVNDFTVGNGDFELVHVASDGSTSPMLAGEALLGESLDPDGYQIDLSLSKPLTQGNYELVLNADTQLAGVDGTSLAVPSSGLVLSDFQLNPPQEGFNSAIDLKTVGPQETVVSGQLDLSTNPGAVQYYKFELAPGHRWLVGLEASPQGDGPALDSAISLFDSQGHLISTSDQALPSDPHSPYLFAGLEPGTYYVGISDQKNTPDASGAYDPGVTEIGRLSPGGPFQLDLLADAADQPTQLLGLRVDHADPLSTDPTGLTLQFSGALNMVSLENSSEPALTLVDEAGQAWSVTPTAYDAGTGQFTVAFDQPLAPGTYTVELSGSNSLVDLAGRAPVAAGLPAGTLGSFVVTPSKLVQGDLGTILPGGSVIGSPVDLAAGQSSTEQFAVVEPGIYNLSGISPASGVHFSVEDASGNILANGPGDSGSGATVVTLNPGIYQLVLTGGSNASQVSITIQQLQNLLDSLVESGVSQGPALNLRLVTPQADFGQGSYGSTIAMVSTPSTISTSSTISSPSAGQSLANASTTTADGSGSLASHSSPAGGGLAIETAMVPAVGLAVPIGPSVAGQVAGAGPVGRPSSQANMIGVVGMSGSSGLPSIVSNSPDLPAALIAIQPSIEGAPEFEVELSPPDPAAQSQGQASTRTGITLEAGLLARPPGSRRADDRSLADADWIGQMVANALDWLDDEPAEVAARAAEPAPISRRPSPSSEPATSEEQGVESASMASPAGIGLVLGMVAYGYRKRLISRKISLAKPGPKTRFQPILAGPHRRLRVRVR